ncbi:cell surface glycoprotein CD200 receptor 1 isoform X1 [Hippoglossus hippoglossus]|uniref:cell surface glycoprotein CD200 receptor 1 isoform X1 n=2 Tax=Hippoglossus hippoglossus TaxID=8267 RepID=UPI00148C2A93|nr:cell surface glycoprotein CD200 receptor 1 isoform X1 [Hippoglossus hippoglossus]
MMLIFATVFLLVPAAWSHEPGTNQSTNVTSTYVIRNLTFNSGSNVNLNCSNRTWAQTIYVIWDMMLTNKICKVSFSNEGRGEDTCKDGKSLRNTSRAQSYLHIPNFSATDVGVYKCNFVYNGGKEDYEINVAITVPPTLSAWIEHGDKMVAVCKAERGKPAANISWSHSRDSLSVETLESDGLITVESRLELDKGTDTKNLTCAFSHPSWEKEKTLVAKLSKDFPWWLILTGVVVSVLLVGFAIFAQKKILMLRRCHQCDSSPSKSPTIEEVEEVEPYASYVQRVNSIYN